MTDPERIPVAHDLPDDVRDDLDAFASAYLRPLVRGLEAYADANDL